MIRNSARKRFVNNKIKVGLFNISLHGRESEQHKSAYEPKSFWALYREIRKENSTQKFMFFPTLSANSSHIPYTHSSRRFKFNWREEIALRRVSKDSPGGNYHRSEIFKRNLQEKWEKKFSGVVKHREKRVQSKQTGILLIIN